MFCRMRRKPPSKLGVVGNLGLNIDGKAEVNLVEKSWVER